MSLTKTYVTIAAVLFLLTFIELAVYGRTDLGVTRTHLLVVLMTAKALVVALVYMNLNREPLTLKLSFFLLIPVGLYFLLFMLYDARWVWLS